MSNEYQKFLLGSVLHWRIAKEQLFKLLKTSVEDKVRLAIVWYKKSYQKYNDVAWNQKEEFRPFLDKRRIEYDSSAGQNLRWWETIWLWNCCLMKFGIFAQVPSFKK